MYLLKSQLDSMSPTESSLCSFEEPSVWDQLARKQTSPAVEVLYSLLVAWFADQGLCGLWQHGIQSWKEPPVRIRHGASEKGESD